MADAERINLSPQDALRERKLYLLNLVNLICGDDKKLSTVQALTVRAIDTEIKSIVRRLQIKR